MRKKKSFLSGVILLATATIIVKLVGFVYRVVLTNIPGYGDEGNGIYGSGFQVYLLLYALSTTGFPSAIAKLVAETTAKGDWRGAHKIFKVSFWMLFISGIMISSVFLTFSKHIARMIGNPRAAYTMAAISPTIFFVSIMAVFRGYFQGLQDMTPQAYSQIIEQVAKTVFTLFLALKLLPYGVELSAAGATFGTTMGAAVGAVYLCILYKVRKVNIWKNINRHCRAGYNASTLSILSKLIKIALPISLGAVILTVTNIIDLGTVMTGLSKAGFDYNTANRLYGILTGKCYVLTHFPTSIFAALSTGLVPAIAASMAVKNYKSATEKIMLSIKMTILLGVPSSVGMAVMADPIIKMLFPGSSEGAYLLTISSFTIIFAGLTQTLSGILQGLGKAVIPALSLLTGAVIKIAMNYYLVSQPSINIKGAVYGTMACYIVSSIICMLALKIKFRLKLGIIDLIIKPVAASLVMGICARYLYVYLMQNTMNIYISTICVILSAIIVYIVELLIMGGITSKEISVLPFGNNINKRLYRLKLLRR